MHRGACVPLRVHTVVISIQHCEEVTMDQLRRDLMQHIVAAVIPADYLDERTVYHLQPSGKFVIGGPQVCSSHTELSAWLSSYNDMQPIQGAFKIPGCLQILDKKM